MQNISDSFINKNRVTLIKKICGEEVGVKFETDFKGTFKNILNNADDKTLKLLKFVHLLDNINEINSENASPYTVGKKNIHIIRNSDELDISVEKISKSKIIGFDTEQKPIFKKGVAPSKIALIQLSDNSDCYVIQAHLIKNIKPILEILTNPNITKVGIGLKSDAAALHKEYGIHLKSCIDFGALFNSKMFHSNDIGAKRSVLLFLNKKLQKSKNISRSNWESRFLSDSQIKYSSEDASCVHDVFCSMLINYSFLLEILPIWFKDQFNENYFLNHLETFSKN